MFKQAEAEVVLSVWEVQAQDEAGEWQTMSHEASKADAVAACASYLASGCAVRVRWAVD